MFKRFFRDRRGNVAMMFSLALVPLLAATGAAIDYSIAYERRLLIQDALDAAALAANRLIGIESNDDVEQAAIDFFTANLVGRIDPIPDIVPVVDGGTVTITTTLNVPTTFLGIAGIQSINFDLLSESVSGGVNLEVALVLDVTLSMSIPNDDKIDALIDAATDLVLNVVRVEQSPYYSKAAIIPYSNGVNVGSLANSVRGAYTSPVTITGASWMVASSQKTISSINQANPARVTTTSTHGYSVGQVVYISGITDNGTNSFADNLNGHYYTIQTVPSTTTFTLTGVNSSSFRSWTSGSGSGTSGITRRCTNASCQLILTESASGTPYTAGTQIFLRNFSPSSPGSLGSQLNNNVYTVGSTVTSTTFSLAGTVGPTFNAYSSGGQACETTGCQYYRFTNMSNQVTVHQIAANCVTERVGAEAYTDAAPGSGTYVGAQYPASGGSCPGSAIVPLTSDRDDLEDAIGDLVTSGSTAGQIGIAWGWYLLSPTFTSGLVTGDAIPAPYDQEDVRKIAVIMTDGEFNTAHCNGVVSQDTASGYVNNSARINCDATNGDPFDQAEELCDAMKEADITIYTVGFDLGNNDDAIDVMAYCASGASRAYLADDATELSGAFSSIGAEITQLRLSR